LKPHRPHDPECPGPEPPASRPRFGVIARPCPRRPATAPLTLLASGWASVGMPGGAPAPPPHQGAVEPPAAGPPPPPGAARRPAPDPPASRPWFGVTARPCPRRPAAAPLAVLASGWASVGMPEGAPAPPPHPGAVEPPAAGSPPPPGAARRPARPPAPIVAAR